MPETTLRIDGMTCAACQHHVERALAGVPGVQDARVNLMAHKAAVTCTTPIPAETLIQAVRQAGYDAAEAHPTDLTATLTQTPAPDPEATRHLGPRAAIALTAGALAMLLSMPLMSMPAPAMPGTTLPAPHATSPDPLLAALTHLLAPLMPAWLMSFPAQPLRWTLCALAVVALLAAGPEVFRTAWRAARHRSTNMNTLVALGTGAAFALSFAATVAPHAFATRGLAADVYYEAVALILGFLLAGRWLEARARHRATDALRGFARLQPAQARLLDFSPGTPSQTLAAAPETLLPVDAIAPGDLLRILPGDRIPVDGIILHGQSAVDESMLTGEPLPVTRTHGQRLAAGTLNLDGALIVRVTAAGSASTLAQMQRLLEQAQSSRAPLQRLADRASAVFVPAVLALAALTFAVWSVAENTAGHHIGFGRPLAVAISVLVIACPCAMGLAVPAAITVAIGRAAQAGLLLKGGEALERLATADILALDKTGTLTEGRPEIAAFLPIPTPYPDGDPTTLLPYAAALERLSTHPLAAAVLRYAEARNAEAGNTEARYAEARNAATQTPPPPGNSPHPSISNLVTLPGAGLQATLELHQTASTPNLHPTLHQIAIGNASLLPPGQPVPQPPAGLEHATPLYFLLDNQLRATFFATDTLRPSASEAIATVRRLGLRPLILTGDIPASATPLAQAAGITDPAAVRASLTPAAKLDAIRALQHSGHRVAMVGDGLNDAAALAQADAGLALASGSDLAREAGDVLLLHPDLRLLPLAIALSRRSVRIMRQNLGWALAYNALGLPLAAGLLYPHFGILLSPVLASAAMALSSVSVLANSLRLRRLPSLP